MALTAPFRDWPSRCYNVRCHFRKHGCGKTLSVQTVGWSAGQTEDVRGERVAAEGARLRPSTGPETLAGRPPRRVSRLRGFAASWPNRNVHPSGAFPRSPRTLGPIWPGRLPGPVGDSGASGCGAYAADEGGDWGAGRGASRRGPLRFVPASLRSCLAAPAPTSPFAALCPLRPWPSAPASPPAPVSPSYRSVQCERLFLGPFPDCGLPKADRRGEGAAAIEEEAPGKGSAGMSSFAFRSVARQTVFDLALRALPHESHTDKVLPHP